MMIERPILFSAEMVIAILEGRKTQTRRVIRSQPNWKFPGNYERVPVTSHVYGLWWATVGFGLACENWKFGNCPYGQPGDKLWVRETFSYTSFGNTVTNQCMYRADGEQDDRHPVWRPSIFMPRWASRITLEIVNIRVERVQDISEGSAIKEGIPYESSGNAAYHRWKFSQLWDSINQKRGYGWDQNPWVWVIEFKEVKNG